MLLRARVGWVPAQEEIDADLNEYGHIGSKCRATYGKAAVEVGAPDKDEPRTEIVDTIANILHYAHSVNVDIAPAIEMAREHFEAEAFGEE